jgi:hypothetical protein
MEINHKSAQIAQYISFCAICAISVLHNSEERAMIRERHHVQDGFTRLVIAMARYLSAADTHDETNSNTGAPQSWVRSRPSSPNDVKLT